MALTQQEREDLEYDIYALENDIELSVGEMNQYEDGEVLRDNTGAEWRHSHTEIQDAINAKGEALKEMREKLKNG